MAQNKHKYLKVSSNIFQNTLLAILQIDANLFTFKKEPCLTKQVMYKNHEEHLFSVYLDFCC